MVIAKAKQSQKGISIVNKSVYAVEGLVDACGLVDPQAKETALHGVSLQKVNVSHEKVVMGIFHRADEGVSKTCDGAAFLSESANAYDHAIYKTTVVVVVTTILLTRMDSPLLLHLAHPSHRLCLSGLYLQIGLLYPSHPFLARPHLFLLSLYSLFRLTLLDDLFLPTRVRPFHLLLAFPPSFPRQKLSESLQVKSERQAIASTVPS